MLKKLGLLILLCAIHSFIFAQNNMPAFNIGKVDRHQIDSLLYAENAIWVDPYKPLVVIYYPGKTNTNLEGNATAKSMEVWHLRLNSFLKRKVKTQAIYICKSKNEIGKRAHIGNWKNDPQQLFEKLFFPKTTDTDNFVVFDTQGNYYAHWGELFQSDFENAFKALNIRKK